MQRQSALAPPLLLWARLQLLAPLLLPPLLAPLHWLLTLQPLLVLLALPHMLMAVLYRSEASQTLHHKCPHAPDHTVRAATRAPTTAHKQHTH